MGIKVIGTNMLSSDVKAKVPDDRYVSTETSNETINEIENEIQGLISAPSSATIGDFLVFTENGWDAMTLSIWQGGNY